MIETSSDEKLIKKCHAFQEKVIKLIKRDKVGPTVAINSFLSLAFKNIYDCLGTEERTREGVILSLESFLNQMREIEEEDDD